VSRRIPWTRKAAKRMKRVRAPPYRPMATSKRSSKKKYATTLKKM